MFIHFLNDKGRDGEWFLEYREWVAATLDPAADISEAFRFEMS